MFFTNLYDIESLFQNDFDNTWKTNLFIAQLKQGKTCRQHSAQPSLMLKQTPEP